ncbi:MAG: oligosaccharide flippase family protein [Ramlibacter sp.]
MSIPRHTAYNLAGGLLPLALSLVTIPIYIGLVGEARYGVLAIAWLLLGYFGLFDLGLGAATAQRIAALESSDARERAQVFWTALVMNFGLGALGGLLLLPTASLYFASSAAIEGSLRPEIASAIPWLAVALPLATLSGVLTGALQGRAKFLELNAISVAGAALTQLLPLAVAVLHGPEVSWLLAAVVLSRCIVLAALFWRCARHVHAGHPRSVSASQARALLQFGGWVTVSSLVGPLMVVLDRFAIGAMLGPKAVAHYTVPFQLAERTSLLPGALTGALFPRMAAAGPAQSGELAGAAIRSLAVVMTPLTAIGILLIHPFLAWWLNPDFAAQAGLPGQLLLLGFWFNAVALVPHALLQAAGRPDTVARCHLLEVVPYLVLLYLALRLFGTVGAAVVFGLRTLADCILLMHYAGKLAVCLQALAAPAVLLVAVFAATRLVPAGWTLPWLGMAGIVVCTATGWALMAAPPQLRSLVQKRFGW